VQTELHRHLDVSTRSSTLLELAQKYALEPQITHIGELKKKILIKEPMKDLNDVLDRFEIYSKVLRNHEDLERIAYEAVTDCYHEGTRKVELRYSPAFAGQFSDLTWNEILDAFTQGMNRALEEYPDMKAGLICIISRDLDFNLAERTAEYYLTNKNRFIAIDLAGHERGFPCKKFEPLFAPVRKESGTHITIHAGEDLGPENIWEAIELLGAERIGHGINCIKDPKLMEHLRDQKICLEVCPTSNYLTQAVSKMSEHPLKKIVEFGIPCSINTDDPGIFELTLPHEIDVARKSIGLSEEQIKFCLDSADRYSFL